jgi:tRNA 2-thiouridine synthesizing protein C
MNNKKSFLFINRRAPYPGTFAKESMDVTLIAAAFNQNVSLLFMDDGVYQLLKAQEPSGINQKNVSLTLPMLEMYDVSNIYVEQASMRARNLTGDDFLIPVKVIDAEQVRELLEQQDILLNF